MPIPLQSQQLSGGGAWAAATAAPGMTLPSQCICMYIFVSDTKYHAVSSVMQGVCPGHLLCCLMLHLVAVLQVCLLAYASVQHMCLFVSNRN